jgi:uncharacterized metal-binding protein YceD (DUF177 family)
MAEGLPDLIDCTRLAEDAAVLERVYALDELPRLKDLLAGPSLSKTAGALHARFAFSKAASGQAVARVDVRATPRLVCQRCMQGFAFPVSGGSEVELASGEDAADAERECFQVDGGGRLSLRELAEEELLLALPIAPACSIPQSCGHSPIVASGVEEMEVSGGMRRPFSDLKDLLKKT